MKRCSKCKKEKASEEFYRNKGKKDGFKCQCKKCEKEYDREHKVQKAARMKEYYQKNKEHFRAYEKEYARTHKVRKSDMMKEYRKGRKDHISAYNKDYNSRHLVQSAVHRRMRKATDIQYKLQLGLRKRFYMALKNNQKKGSAVRDLGCTISEFKFYLEGQFQDGMSWDNWGPASTERRTWHIDHKIPLAFFDLTNREQLLKAVHYTNLQPMWAMENLTKKKKIPV